MFGGHASQHSRHIYGYKLSSSSRRLVPLFVWGRLHTGASQEKWNKDSWIALSHIDDVLSLNNTKFVNRIYHIELEIKDTTYTARCFIPGATPRDWQWEPVKNETDDKRDDFSSPIVGFLFICNDNPAALVYISQLLRYSRACGSYQDFLDIGLLQTRKLLNQGFLLVKLKSSLRKFYGPHHDLLYGLYYICITNDHKYVPLVVNTSWSCPNSRLITGTRVT